ncbi:hypothetical protein PMKS-002571 [Pichia membranifaciens]|uniref:Uncharacterized protein n=1 Tax=Pichia membranifaciens TaxID=4926 RepID=A0A1Q2YHY0_9ASCO|nr:hypothetical protein PMKS-002571 [Pichia membranifaciens]
MDSELARSGLGNFYGYYNHPLTSNMSGFSMMSSGMSNNANNGNNNNSNMGGSNSLQQTSQTEEEQYMMSPSSSNMSESRMSMSGGSASMLMSQHRQPSLQQQQQQQQFVGSRPSTQYFNPNQHLMNPVLGAMNSGGNSTNSISSLGVFGGLPLNSTSSQRNSFIDNEGTSNHSMDVNGSHLSN